MKERPTHKFITFTVDEEGKEKQQELVDDLNKGYEIYRDWVIPPPPKGRLAFILRKKRQL